MGGDLLSSSGFGGGLWSSNSDSDGGGNGLRSSCSDSMAGFDTAPWAYGIVGLNADGSKEKEGDDVGELHVCGEEALVFE